MQELEIEEKKEKQLIKKKENLEKSVKDIQNQLHKQQQQLESSQNVGGTNSKASSSQFTEYIQISRDLNSKNLPIKQQLQKLSSDLTHFSIKLKGVEKELASMDSYEQENLKK